jgi:cytochrome c oxidase assembly protein subunit 15
MLKIMYSKQEKRFIRINLITIISLFFLILAGGVVRSSGSGMGCPDWPKCFDQYIPPTDISQLPADYQQKYVEGRLQKNERFAKMLDKTGYSDLAYKIRHDENIKLPEEFNAGKTYTEYVNRLIGALTGVFMLLAFVFSIHYIKSYSRITVLSFLNLVLVVFQAWLGSIVVSTNLVAWIITLHMLVAVLIIAVAIYTYHYAKAINDVTMTSNQAGLLLRLVLLLGLVLSVIQITIGTEVREAIDALLEQNPGLVRGEWLKGLGDIYTYHKDIAIAVVVLNIGVYALIRRKLAQSYQHSFSKVLIGLVLFQFLTGVVLDYLGMPPFAQALHILFAVLFFSAQFYLLLMLKPALRKV